MFMLREVDGIIENTYDFVWPGLFACTQVEAGMKITSGAVYNAVLMFMLREADGIFKRMLGLDKIEQGRAKGKARELTGEDIAAVTSGTK
jgi:hypothetical protein